MFFLQPLALPRAGHGPCKQHKTTLSTKRAYMCCVKYAFFFCNP